VGTGRWRRVDFDQRDSDSSIAVCSGRKEGEVDTCGAGELKRSESRWKNGWRAEEGWSSPKGSSGVSFDPVAPDGVFWRWSGPTIVGSVGGHGVLHLEGETQVRESGKGGHDGDRWFKMAGAAMREEGG
jgi:hypothetical protein